MIAMPEERPDTVPVDELTAAILIADELHNPPAVRLLKVVVALKHRLLEPVIVNGSGLTVNTAITAHVPTEYVIVVVPEVIAVTIPVVEPIVATLVLLLAHAPPETPFIKVVLAPTQTTKDPPIGVGTGRTVTVLYAVQEEGNVYVIVAEPTDKAETAPDADPIATMPVDPTLHIPPAIESVNVAVLPKHSNDVPNIVGIGFIVTWIVIVSEAPIQSVTFILKESKPEYPGV